ncbi:unnamed protein product, partial [Mesorhabditis belari]|uniref:Homeobox domain-containing protein n=1 Tax=Mesorhabditis belari TaxID=2138241 RepID=A0AAF3F5D7_9BILA
MAQRGERQTASRTAVSMLPSMSLFTVEQLELIRRLKSTGINAEAIVEAFRTLDEIERELEAAKQQSAALAALITQPQSVPTSMQSQVILDPSPGASTPTSTPASLSFNQPPLGDTTPARSPILLQALRAQNPVALTISATSPVICAPASPDRPVSIQTVPLASTASESPLFSYESPSSGGCRPIRSLRTPMREITTLDDPTELDDFMRQGEEGCINDMKQFITQFSLRQTTVAMMTGVSQPYISKLLNGNHRELSLRCRKNIYSWYLNCRRHPEKLAAFLADPATRLETNGDGELVPQRRERYVFRPILIRMLEQFFAQTPFPDLNRRIEIATACNHALQMDKKGVGLMPKEVVSPQVVANWFANKRKELRRKSNEEAQQTHPGGLQFPPVTPTTPGAMPLLPNFSLHSQQQTDSANRHGSPSCSDMGSTPSPLPDENSADSDRNITFDIASLAARLGFQFPSVGLPLPIGGNIGAGGEIEITPVTTISSLASQLLGFPFNVVTEADGTPATAVTVPSTLASQQNTQLPVSLASQEQILSQIYQSTLHQQLLKMEKVE